MSICDQVFERLTRGPFPADSAEDARIERHLERCHDCRRLAEALRPAVEMFHETLEATDDLPRYEGRLSRGSAARPALLVAEPPLPELRRAPRTVAQVAIARDRTPFAASAWRRFREAGFLTAAVAASFGVAVVLASLATPAAGDGSRGDARPADVDWTRVARSVSASRVGQWDLPIACADVSTREAPAAGSHSVACCTVCHAADGASPRLTTANPRPSLLLSSCATCHY